MFFWPQTTYRAILILIGLLVYKSIYVLLSLFIFVPDIICPVATRAFSSLTDTNNLFSSFCSWLQTTRLLFFVSIRIHGISFVFLKIC